MGKNRLSGAREAPLYPKSSGVSATNENQMVATAAFQWYYSEDKKTIYVVMTDGYVFNSSWPVGSTYMQLPGKDDPATLGLPGTWEDISSEYEGRFFRVAGGDAEDFATGTGQLDQMQGHWHDNYEAADNRYVRSGSSWYGTTSSGSAAEILATDSNGDVLVRDASTDGTNGTPRTGAETRPVNRTIKVWERTA